MPYIYEDRLSKEVVVDALLKMYNMAKEEREALGKKGRSHVFKNYNFENYEKSWIELLLRIHEQHGSWEKRKNYSSWKFREI